MRCKLHHIIFSTFSLKFRCKICVQKEEIHNFKNHILVTWPATNWLILRYDSLIVFEGNETDATWPLSANGLISLVIKIMSASRNKRIAWARLSTKNHTESLLNFFSHVYFLCSNHDLYSVSGSVSLGHPPASIIRETRDPEMLLALKSCYEKQRIWKEKLKGKTKYLF